MLGAMGGSWGVEVPSWDSLSPPGEIMNIIF